MQGSVWKCRMSTPAFEVFLWCFKSRAVFHSLPVGAWPRAPSPSCHHHAWPCCCSNESGNFKGTHGCHLPCGLPQSALSSSSSSIFTFFPFFSSLSFSLIFWCLKSPLFKGPVTASFEEVLSQLLHPSVFFNHQPQTNECPARRSVMVAWQRGFVHAETEPRGTTEQSRSIREQRGGSSLLMALMMLEAERSRAACLLQPKLLVD